MEAAEATISEVMKTLGRRGGIARAKSLSPAERRKSALKASKAAAKARTKKAKQQKAKA